MEKRALSEALAMAGRFVSPRSPSEAFKKVWLTSVDGWLSVIAANHLGVIEACVECEDSIAACVDHATLAGLVRSVKRDTIGMRNEGSYLAIYTDAGMARLPDFEIRAPELIVPAHEDVIAASREVKRCAKSLRCLSDSSEVTYGQSQTLSTEDGILRFTSNTSRMWGCAWTTHEGESKLSCRIPINSMLAFVDCLPGDNTSFAESGNLVSVVSGNVSMALPTEAQGQRHRSYDQASTMWQNAPLWHIELEDLKEFLSQVSIFSTPEAKGMWMDPTPDGVVCRYTGLSDGTYGQELSVNGYCEALLPGSCEGGKVYVNSQMLGSALAGANDEGFCIRTTHSGMFVFSAGYVMGLGLMEPPR